MAATAAIAGVATTVGSTIANSGGSDGGGALPTSGGSASIYQPTNPGGFDQNYQNIFNSMYGTATTLPANLLSAYQANIGAYQGNPLYAGYQGAAQHSGDALLQSVAPHAFAGAGALQDLASSTAPYASQILQAGFDPQGDLYNRTQQQVRDQLSATNAMSGLSGTPYGAGVQNQGLSNFNLDWQDRQLGRQNTATQGFNTLNSAIGRDYAGSVDLGNLGATAYAQAGALPYQAYINNLNTNMGALDSLTNASQNVFGLPQKLLGDAGQYMQLSGTASNLALSNQGQGFNQGQTIGNNIGQGLGALSSNTGFTTGLDNLFGGFGGTTYPSGYSPSGFTGSAPQYDVNGGGLFSIPGQ